MYLRVPSLRPYFSSVRTEQDESQTTARRERYRRISAGWKLHRPGQRSFCFHRRRQCAHNVHPWGHAQCRTPRFRDARNLVRSTFRRPANAATRRPRTSLRVRDLSTRGYHRVSSVVPRTYRIGNCQYRIGAGECRPLRDVSAGEGRFHADPYRHGLSRRYPGQPGDLPSE